MSINPARPAAGVVLCRVDEVADPGTKGFSFRQDEALFHGLVLRQGDGIRGFVDSCPHAGWRLAGIGDNHLTKDGRFLLCSGHGALFRLEDAECVSGPCFGDRLEDWPVRIEDGVVVTDEPSVRKGPPYWGGCLCGAVRFQATAEPINVRACHCRTCQRAASAPFFVRAVFPLGAVEITGELIRYRSSARLNRTSCARCGTLLFGEPIDRPTFIAVSTAAIDDRDALPPQMHIWVSDKVAWLQLDDGLPQYPQGAPG